MRTNRLFPLTLLFVWIICVLCLCFSSFNLMKDVDYVYPVGMHTHGLSREPLVLNAKFINESSMLAHAIVDIRVDVSNFQAINTTTCKYMMADVEVAPAYSMPLIALASFPRSGNTWSRSLIQIATKFSTGSVHWEAEGKSPLKEWFKAGSEDFRLRKGVCVKTHFYSPEHIALFRNGAILLIRNPYYSLISEFLRFYSRVKNATTSEIIQSMRHGDERWQLFLPYQAKKWRDTAINWITHCKRLMIVFYEDLEGSPVYELTRMVTFLGQPIQPQRIQCALHWYEPMKGRKNHSSQMTFDPYTSAMRDIIDGYVTEVNQTLRKMKVTPLPVYDGYLLP